MPIHSWAQHFPNSCGAASAVVAVAELQNLPGHVANSWMSVNETPVYNRISFPAGGGYSWPGLIYQELRNSHGRTVTICEDRTITGPLQPANPLSPFHAAYAQHLALLPVGVVAVNKIFGAHVFQTGARVMLAMIRPGNALHYLLGRTDSTGQLVAMDPDDGLPPAGNGHNAIFTVGDMRSHAFFTLGTPAAPQLRFSGIYVIVT